MIEQLRIDYPQFRFRFGKVYRWRPTTHTITLAAAESGPKAQLLALHELAHALLNHQDNAYDLQRLKYEVAAWELVRSDLAPRYAVNYDEELVQDALDTYRAWLHQKSACPVCKQCRFQTLDGGYSCPNGC